MYDDDFNYRRLTYPDYDNLGYDRDDFNDYDDYDDYGHNLIRPRINHVLPRIEANLTFHNRILYRVGQFVFYNIISEHNYSSRAFLKYNIGMIFRLYIVLLFLPFFMCKIFSDTFKKSTFKDTRNPLLILLSNYLGLFTAFSLNPILLIYINMRLVYIIYRYKASNWKLVFWSIVCIELVALITLATLYLLLI